MSNNQGWAKARCGAKRSVAVCSLTVEEWHKWSQPFTGKIFHATRASPLSLTCIKSISIRGLDLQAGERALQQARWHLMDMERPLTTT
jgi:hypothetical protein